MTTLPPEDPNLSGAGETPPAPPQVPAAPQVPADAQTPAAPQAAPQAPPPVPPAAAPQQPGGYQAPQQPNYQQPPQGAGQPPQGGYQQVSGSDPVGNITLNYWLSVFFVWVPALIFFIIEKDKGNPQAQAYHRDNLNFALVRTIAYVAIIVVGFIPYLGIFLALLLWIAQIVLFVFHIMAAVKAPDAFRRGEPAPFIFNLPMVK